MDKNIVSKIAEIVEANSVQGGKFRGQICTLSLIDEDGFPSASIITPSKADGINWITFATLLDQNRAKRAANCNRASVCFGTTAYCLNLVGVIEVITLLDVKREMWYDSLEHFFTGPDDPNYCVLKFTTKRYKYFSAKDGEEVGGNL